MYFVYLLESINFEFIYKGFTEQNIFDRLKDHNQGKCKYTSKYKPWKLKFYCAFENKKTATDFEQYLKTASGIAFSRKRLLPKKT